MQSKNFDEFWQVFLQVSFHQGNPERWSKREEKALWVEKCLELSRGNSIADLGCGDGLLDICLSRLGYEVTAVDRSPSIIAHAKTEDDTRSVTFEVGDLRKFALSKQSLDGVIVHETIGLMSQDDDLDLLRRSFDWLKPGGRILIDCPMNPSPKNDWSKEFQDGRVDAFTSFDKNTSIHQLNFEFHPKTGEAFNLHDPSCPERHDGPGISRYIYLQSELIRMLQDAGFEPQTVPHYYGDTYFALVGVK